MAQTYNNFIEQVQQLERIRWSEIMNTSFYFSEYFPVQINQIKISTELFGKNFNLETVHEAIQVDKMTYCNILKWEQDWVAVKYWVLVCA